MNNVKTIHFTFDYELFFGSKSGSVINSIIKPTKMILDSFEKYNSKATFFIDYLMILKMQTASISTKKDASLIIDQLLEIVSNGHRIELHIHPHWEDAKFIDGKWDFSNMKRYRLHSFSKSKILKFFIDGVDFLEKICRQVQKDYKIKSFRAGGWCIQPFDLLKEAFYKTNLKIDSSVSYGAVSNSKYLKFDYSNAPDKESYLFENDITVENDSGSFMELPISYYNHNFIHRLLNTIDKKIFSKKYLKIGDGCHSGYGADNPKLKSNFFKSEKRMLSNDGVNPEIIYNEIRLSKKSKLVVIGHPKDLTLRSIDVLEKICRNKDFNVISI
jgi:hypothetical protein